MGKNQSATSVPGFTNKLRPILAWMVIVILLKSRILLRPKPFASIQVIITARSDICEET